MCLRLKLHEFQKNTQILWILGFEIMGPTLTGGYVGNLLWHRQYSQGLEDRSLTKVSTCVLYFVWWLTLNFSLTGFRTTKERSSWACLWGFLIMIIGVERVTLNAGSNLPWATYWTALEWRRRLSTSPEFMALSFLTVDSGFRRPAPSHACLYILPAITDLYHPKLLILINSSSHKVGLSGILSQQWEKRPINDVSGTSIISELKEATGEMGHNWCWRQTCGPTCVQSTW